MEAEKNTYMATNATKDMAEGSPVKLVLGFFIPVLCGLLFQQLYNIADTITVGKCLGVRALTAVGSTGSINFMIIGFCLGVYSGFTTPVVQRFGEENEKTPGRFVANSTQLVVLFSAAMAVAVYLLCRGILELMQMPEDIIDGVYSYILVIFPGIPATCLYNLLFRTICSLGDSTVPLIFLVFSSVVNVAPDFFTALVLKMGVSGTAWTTTMAQAVSGILCLFYAREKLDTPRINDDERRPGAHYMKIPCSMGTPMGLQHSITATGSVIFQITVNSLGPMAMTAVMAGGKISMFFCCPLDTLEPVMVTHGGQNVGVREPDCIDQGLRAEAVMGCVYAVITLTVLCIFRQWIALMFMDKGEGEILRDTRLFLIGSSLFYILLVFVNAVRLTIRGLGYSRLVIIVGVHEMVTRFFVGFCLVPVSDHIAVCIASPMAWIAADLFLIPAYRHVMKNPNQLFYGRSRATDAAQ